MAALYGALNGHTPIDALHAKQDVTPFWDDIEAQYDPTKERFQVAHYPTDLSLSRQTQARFRNQPQ